MRAMHPAVLCVFAPHVLSEVFLQNTDILWTPDTTAGHWQREILQIGLTSWAHS